MGKSIERFKGVWLLALIMVICSCSAVCVNAAPKASASGRQQALAAYNRFLSQDKVAFYSNDKTHIKIKTTACKFALINLDKDNIPELVVCAEYGVSHCGGYYNLFTFKNGKMKFVYNTGDSFKYFKKTGVFTWNYFQWGRDLYAYYKMGKGVEDLKLSKVVVYGDTGKVDSREYGQGDIDIPKSGFMKALRYHTKGKKEKKPTYFANNKSNRKAHLLK